MLSILISLIICICTYYKLECSKINVNMNLEKTNNILISKFPKVKEVNTVENLDDKIFKTLNETQKNDTRTWKLEIPKINLIAEIAEGTNEEVLDVYIGYFEETQKVDGNIGLAAHNRGYKVNYFNRLKELEIGDEIIYTCFGESKKYKVFNKLIIEDTNWEFLKDTGENILTLITCMENQPSKRRCVQAKEII